VKQAISSLGHTPHSTLVLVGFRWCGITCT